MDERFLRLELILTLVAMIGAPIVGRLIDWGLNKLAFWKAKRHIQRGDFNIEKVLRQAAPPSPISSASLAEIQGRLGRAKIRLTHEQDMDKHHKKWAKESLDLAEQMIAQAQAENNAALLKEAKEAISDAKRLMSKNQWVYALGLIVVLCAGVYLTDLLGRQAGGIERLELLGMPLSVVIWGWVGGSFRTLVNHAGRKPASKPLRPFEAFIERPFLGAVLGLVLCLLLISGLLVITGARDVANINLVNALAFAAAFSYDYVIPRISDLAKRTLSPQESSEEKAQRESDHLEDITDEQDSFEQR